MPPQCHWCYLQPSWHIVCCGEWFAKKTQLKACPPRLFTKMYGSREHVLCTTRVILLPLIHNHFSGIYCKSWACAVIWFSYLHFPVTPRGAWVMMLTLTPIKKYWPTQTHTHTHARMNFFLKLSASAVTQVYWNTKKSFTLNKNQFFSFLSLSLSQTPRQLFFKSY